MKKQLRGLFCAAALAAVLALPARAAEQTHRAYLCGYPDGSIQPGALVTRAQLACALVRLAEEPLPEGAVENYLASRERKLRLSDAMFQALEETAAGSGRLPQSAGGSCAACWTRWRTRRRAARYFRR